MAPQRGRTQNCRGDKLKIGGDPQWKLANMNVYAKWGNAW